MSGHSKWASIKHKKGAADAKRGKIFTKLIKEITVAARMGGGDEDGNPRLRTAVIKARAANMPKDNVERAIKKGTGDLEGVNYTELTYEAYGPGGVAILVNTLTDNKNRTAADVRSILTKGGGRLGDTGCVSYLFQRKGVISLDGEGISFEELFEVALDAGAEDVTNDGGFIEVITAPDDFEAVLSALQEKNYSYSMAEITMVPDATMNLDENGTRKALRLIERLDDLDDVQSVSSNIDIPDDFDPDAE
jgi:YebC/PmpR family DNA-binding regulatory protein